MYGKHFLNTNYVNRSFNLNVREKVEVCDTFDDCYLLNMK